MSAPVLVGAAVAMLLAACGGTDGEPSSDQGAPVVTTEWTYTPTTSAGPPDCPPPEAVVYDGPLDCELPAVVFDDDADSGARVRAISEAVLEAGLTEQGALLADGDVTVAEQRQANQSALDCMTAQGMEVAQFDEYEGLYGTDFFFTIAWGTTTPEEGADISTRCENDHLTWVKWAVTILRGNRFTERAKSVLQDCMATYGVTDDVGDTLDELREVSPSEDATLDCTTRAENRPTVRPPPGYDQPPDE